MRKKVVVAISAGDFAEEIEISEIGCQTEIQTGPNRSFVPCEWQSWRRIAKIRRARLKDAGEAPDIVVRPGIKQVHIVGHARRTVHNSGDTTNENEIDATSYELRKKTLELRAHDRRVFLVTDPWRAFSPARRSSEVKPRNFTNFSSRCAGVSFKFSRNRL